jgi:hypothetical protein
VVKRHALKIRRAYWFDRAFSANVAVSSFISFQRSDIFKTASGSRATRLRCSLAEATRLSGFAGPDRMRTCGSPVPARVGPLIRLWRSPTANFGASIGDKGLTQFQPHDVLTSAPDNVPDGR